MHNVTQTLHTLAVDNSHHNPFNRGLVHQSACGALCLVYRPPFVSAPSIHAGRHYVAYITAKLSPSAIYIQVTDFYGRK